MNSRGSLTMRVGLILFGAVSLLAFALGITGRAPEAPPRVRVRSAQLASVDISRTEFSRLIEQLSEPEGYFDTDNFVSNETSYLHVIDRLTERVQPGGVYFGVGPAQNFSYIVHARPTLAIITDIRRQNMLLHLLFKVLIEDAENRSDFLCRLFSKDCQGLDSEAGLPSLLQSVRRQPGSDATFQANLAGILQTLGGDYQIALSSEDESRIEYIYRSFHDEGLGIRFRTLGRAPLADYPTMEALLLETDLSGRYRSYLADEASFAWLQDFQRQNRLIPIVGDFSGEDALSAVAEFLTGSGLEISVFYASNVEFYLFGSPSWDRYLDNVRRLPFAFDAVFIRAYFPTYGIRHPQNVVGHRPTTLIQGVGGFLADADSGRLRSYWDVVSRHNY